MKTQTLLKIFIVVLIFINIISCNSITTTAFTWPESSTDTNANSEISELLNKVVEEVEERLGSDQIKEVEELETQVATLEQEVKNLKDDAGFASSVALASAVMLLLVYIDSLFSAHKTKKTIQDLEQQLQALAQETKGVSIVKTQEMLEAQEQRQQIPAFVELFEKNSGIAKRDQQKEPLPSGRNQTTN